MRPWKSAPTLRAAIGSTQPTGTNERFDGGNYHRRSAGVTSFRIFDTHVGVTYSNRRVRTRTRGGAAGVGG
jgi:hypothetical protein